MKKKFVVRYSTENPAYKESRGMTKAVIVFVLILVVLSYVY